MGGDKREKAAHVCSGGPLTRSEGTGAKGQWPGLATDEQIKYKMDLMK